eukprot:7175810-Alexandrium_andersonii.AAC.1
MRSSALPRFSTGAAADEPGEAADAAGLRAEGGKTGAGALGGAPPEDPAPAGGASATGPAPASRAAVAGCAKRGTASSAGKAGGAHVGGG